MPASLSYNDRVWARCRNCGHTIWKYARGKVWRTAEHDSSCPAITGLCHIPEY